MKNQEKQMSHEESFALIQSMIASARHNVSKDGFYLLLWGTLVIASCLANYAMLSMDMGNISGIPWMIMPMIGVPIGIWYNRKAQKSGLAKTHLDTQITYMWWAYGVTLFLVILYSGYKEMSPVPFIMMITGMVTFGTGMMIRFKPLIIGGIIFWTSAVISFNLPTAQHLLLEAAAVFIGYIIPGILLSRLAKKDKDV
jgi:FtsH-binding integral membrane protein